MRSKTPLQAEKILTAAAQLFARHRFHEARMEDIAALAEVGKGTLYRYFKDKEELYLALLQRAAEGISQRLHQGVASAEGARAQLEAITEGIIGYFDDNPHLFDLILHAEAMQKADQEFLWQKTRNETQVLVKGIMTRAAELGEFCIDDPDLALLMLLGGLRSVLRFGVRPRPPGLAASIVDGFLAGYARQVVPVS